METFLSADPAAVESSWCFTLHASFNAITKSSEASLSFLTMCNSNTEEVSTTLCTMYDPLRMLFTVTVLLHSSSLPVILAATGHCCVHVLEDDRVCSVSDENCCERTIESTFV